MRDAINKLPLSVSHRDMAAVTRRLPHKHAVYRCIGGMSISLPGGLWFSLWLLLDWVHEERRGEIITTVSASRYSLCSFPHTLVINWSQMGFNWFCSCEGSSKGITCWLMSRKCREEVVMLYNGQSQERINLFLLSRGHFFLVQHSKWKLQCVKMCLAKHFRVWI